MIFQPGMELLFDYGPIDNFQIERVRYQGISQDETGWRMLGWNINAQRVQRYALPLIRKVIVLKGPR
jgi:hypothetical protein